MSIFAENAREAFAAMVPTRTRCADVLSDGLVYRSAAEALEREHIQLNTNGRVSWISFDVDRPDAVFAARDGVLPPATVSVRNPSNGHCHLLYRLASPVPTTDAARVKPLLYLAAVQRGMTLRLDADRGYSGLTVKNPMHRRWDPTWGRLEPYAIGELADWLHAPNMKRVSREDELAGLGRNCTVFSELRKFAYAEVRRFKREGASRAQFQRRLEDVAIGMNTQFPEALPLSEIRAIARSVAKWVWRNFSVQRFSVLQSGRATAGNLARGRKTIQALSELFEQAERSGQGPVYPDMANVLLVSRWGK